MTAQDGLAYGVGLLALAYLVWRMLRRRRAGTCCGEAECPAAKQVVQKLSRSKTSGRAGGAVHTPHTDL